jgi:GNAT superfamily N-acetyltransferase
MSKLTIRVLDPEEHEKLIGLGPFKDRGPDPATSVVVVAEDDAGRVIGYWCAFNAVHLEPLWVDEPERGNGVGMALWGGLREALQEHGVSNAFAMIADEDLVTHLPLAVGKLGFKRVPVSTLFIDLVGDTEGLVRENQGKDGH